VLDTLLERGQSWHQVLTPDLAVRADATASGWEFEIGPAAPAAGGWAPFIYTLTPPYRGAHPRSVTTDYGVRAQEAVLDSPRRFWFLANAQQANQAQADLDEFLWPGPDGDADTALARLAALARGRGRLDLSDAVVQAPSASGASAEPWSAEALGSIQRLRVRITLEFPPGFAPAPGLKADTVSCPADDGWPLEPAQVQ
jgi:hypothetical protein